MGLFRHRQTGQDQARAHGVTLDLIEQVAALRGQVRALESEWDDMRAQIRKGYQRMEKAFERLDSGEEGATPSPGPVLEPAIEPLEGPPSFIDKLRALK